LKYADGLARGHNTNASVIDFKLNFQFDGEPEKRRERREEKSREEAIASRPQNLSVPPSGLSGSYLPFVKVRMAICVEDSGTTAVQGFAVSRMDA
jgi:hypothetical protein